jgi:membrane protease YdiL (CAAX protease family)
MTIHNTSTRRFVTSAPITSAQLWLIIAWVLAGGELVRYLGREAGAGATTTKNGLAIGFYGVIVLWMLWLRRRNGLDVPRLLGPPPTRPSRMLVVLAGPSLTLVWLGLWTALLYAQAVQAGPAAPLPPPDDVIDWRHPTSALLRLGIVVGLGPAVEELLFRGILLNRVTQMLGASAAGGLLALLFAAGHVKFLPALCLALLVTVLYRRTGSLWIAMGAHSLNNALVVVWSAAVAWLISRNGAQVTWPGLLWIARAALLTGVIGLVLVFRSRALHATAAEH